MERGPAKVSVIIPVYNVEPYLKRCLDSIIGQRLREIEIICVDDASSDGSLGILREYEKNDARVRVIRHEKNSGLSQTRLTGLAAARGKYAQFVDSDDWIDADYVESMHAAIEGRGADIVKNTNVLKIFPDSTRDLSQDASLFSANSYISRREFLAGFDILFPIGLRYEDVYFTCVVFNGAAGAFSIKGGRYHYCAREDSIIGFETRVDNTDIIEIVRMVMEYYRAYGMARGHTLPIAEIRAHMSLAADPEGFFSKAKPFFESARDDIGANLGLYGIRDKLFFRDMIECKSHGEYIGLNPYSGARDMLNVLRRSAVSAQGGAK